MVATLKRIVTVLFVASAAILCAAEDAAEADRGIGQEPVFRKRTTDDKLAAKVEGIVIGNYFLAPRAVERLCKVYTLEMTLNSIKHFDWSTPQWSKQNAELTVRQRMDDYLQTALAFYEGRGKRNSGLIGRRQEKFTDAELGDQQLSKALMTVVMATMWDTPLEDGQAQRLDAVLKKRLEMVAERK